MDNRRIPKIILKQILVCDKCVLFTFDKSLLENHKHIELHQCSDQCNESGLHQCPNCEYKAKDKHTISRHIRSVHLKIRHLSCKICDFKTAEGVHLQLHIKRKHKTNQSIISCKKCPKLFFTKDDFEKHMKIVHLTKRPWKCGQCNFAAIEPGRLNSHVDRIHRKEPYKCDICDFVTRNKIFFEKHSHKTHACTVECSKNGFHQCNKCEYSSKERGNLIRHIRNIHLNILRFHCDICDFKCNLDANLQRHIKRIHQHGPKEYGCDACDKRFFSKAELKTHTSIVHLKERHSACNMCDYRAINNKILNEHKNGVHLKVKNNKCEICEFATAYKQTLSDHVRFFHNKEKSHCCTDCNYKASFAYSLKKHQMQKHAKIEDKIFHECEVCHYKTVSKTTLRQHNKTVHLNIRPYFCNICGHKYPLLSNLNVHLKSFHTSDQDNASNRVPTSYKVTDFQCDFCQKYFGCKSTLTKHIKRCWKNPN
jgi:KRAB domain-containing zinc finger protein